ncbi:MAG: HlyC/CorC family transporter [Acidiferrobacterales bacterium]|nr:HlyC/CorC family transporter [Acidiferrobacterales bacterium]
MQDIPIGALLTALVLLIFLSAFFSASEIAVMSINRYRLRHLVESGHRGARVVDALLARPDRLLGIILLGNNFVNIAASSVATILAIRLYGEAGILAAAVLLTIVILIFAEVGPKTLAAMHPERIAFPAGMILRPLLTVLYPLVWLINILANLVLRIFGVTVGARAQELSMEELRAAVREAGSLIPESHQNMLLGILDLEKTSVEEVMVPRNRIQGIDLDKDWGEIEEQIMSSRYTRLPVYRSSLDNIVGIVHLRKALNLAGNKNLTMETLEKIIAEPYFIPKGTPLNTQLLNFRDAKRRRGLVIDEYGDILGLVTLEEILEEIVGEFTTSAHGIGEGYRLQDDGSYIVKGSTSLRDLNRQLDWHLPTKGQHTLNGMITEYLEAIPEVGTSLLVDDYAVEVLRTRGTAVEVARIIPQRRKDDEAADETEAG